MLATLPSLRVSQYLLGRLWAEAHILGLLEGLRREQICGPCLLGQRDPVEGRLLMQRRLRQRLEQRQQRNLGALAHLRLRLRLQQRRQRRRRRRHSMRGVRALAECMREARQVRRQLDLAHPNTIVQPPDRIASQRVGNS